ncbi:MAG: putative DNA-binding protein [Firmicutes bacterium HGW-Firmicutes-14]|jgi:hypothetical protein|nr:MAG: putative DNA-binding protein [Firmicutes bacterium HGW-Firmicutes-14]
MVKKIEQVALLFDFYGELLTEKQQDILSLYYEQDLSLGEIAREFAVSRQAVHDIIKRGEKILEGYEEKLKLVRKFTLEREKLETVLNLVDDLRDNKHLKEKIKDIINEIVDLQHKD